MEHVAEDASWRDASTRILVWFGDAPGHDPRAGSTEASATAALLANNIVVEALDAGSLDYTGQATRITAATGGHLNTLSLGSVDDVVNAIGDAIESVFEDYNTVTLDVSDVPFGVSVAVAPTDHTGDFDRSEERTFEFDVTFTGEAVGGYVFEIDALVDGGIIATEYDHIQVGAVPIPAALPLFGSALLGVGAFGWRRRQPNA